MCLVCCPDVYPYMILFLQFVRWQNSKRLLYGSLVCLSCNNFESFLYATVSDRDPKNLQKGQVQIIFTEDSRYKLARIPVRHFMVYPSKCFTFLSRSLLGQSQVLKRFKQVCNYGSQDEVLLQNWMS